MSIRNVVLGAALALTASGAAAQGNLDKLDKAYRSGPCSNDLKSFCARVVPGELRVADCLATYFRQLQPNCRSAITAARNRFDALVEACRGDAEKLCKGVPYREGRVLTCLKNRESSLGAACAAEFKRVGSDQTITQ